MQLEPRPGVPSWAIVMPAGPDPVAEPPTGGVRRTIEVIYTPLPSSVARLTTTGANWVLYLDSDSPAEDHCWALLDLVQSLTRRLDTTGVDVAVDAPQLHMVSDFGHDSRSA